MLKPTFAATMALIGLSYPELGENFWANTTTARTGFVFLEVFAAPDGEVDDCEILYNDLTANQAERMCNQVRRKEVAAPAYDQNGKSVHGTAIFQFAATLGSDAGPVALQREPELTLEVASLLNAEGPRKVVGLRVLVDQNGQIEYCESDTSIDDAYVQVACEQLGLYPHRVRFDRRENPVRYVTHMSVDFVMAGR